MLFPSNFKRRSQDLKNTYFDAAQFYWGSANSWKKNNNLFNFYSTIVEIPYHESIDIDTMEDWKLAELIYKNKK
jgi:CMP-N-acetylneuraminic acid synthetase